MLTFNRRRRPPLDSVLIHGAQLDLSARKEMRGRILIIFLRRPLIVAAAASKLRIPPQDWIDVYSDMLIALMEGRGPKLNLIYRLH